MTILADHTAAEFRAAAARRALTDAVHQRDLEHAGQYEAFRAAAQRIWSDHPGDDGHRLALNLLRQFGTAWEHTDARHDGVAAAAIKKLDSLEVR